MTKMAKRDLTLKVGQIKNIELHLDEIEVGERFRKDLGDVEALATNISKEGLIQPIAVVENPRWDASSEESPTRPYKLIAGGRRYAALEFIKNRDEINTISCRLFEKEMSELQIRLLEFAENFYRKDLGWQEDCDLKKRILDLQQKIHGVKTSTAKNAPGFSLTDLAKMTGKSKGGLSDDIQMAKMMEDVPEVDWNQFETKNDARKALKTARKKVNQTVEAKKARVSLGTGDSLKKKIIDSYHVEDFFEGVKKIGDSTIDIVELDPPYGIELEDKKKDYSYTGYNEVKAEDYPQFMIRVYRECYRVLKPNSWLICWFGHNPWFEPTHQWIQEVGFKNRRMPAAWVKGEESDNHVVEKTSGQCMQPDRALASTFELFFYARKGVPILAKPGMTNVFGYKPIPAQLKVHPTERPIEMIADILTTFAQPNANVLVPFAGSGNTLIAAAKNNMVPVGFDLTEEYYESYIVKCHKLL